MCLLGSRRWIITSRGPKSSQTPHFGGLNRHFKPNMRKIQIAISSDLCIRLTLNLTGSCGQHQRLRRWYRMVVKQFQDGGRPPFWKSIYRHIVVVVRSKAINHLHLAVVRMSTIGLSVYSHLSWEHVWHMTSALTLSASQQAVGQFPMTSDIQTSSGRANPMPILRCATRVGLTAEHSQTAGSK